MAGQSFRDAELAGWDHKAGYWDDTLGAVTQQAVGPLLDAAGAAPGVRLLDIACGTGALAAAAAGRGAEVVGMDFAPTMVAEATRRHPGVEFRVGDAEAIPLADASMDVVTCSFGLLHMERPERVLAEVARVLRPSAGRFAATAWAPEGDFFALVGQAVQAHADMTVSLPPAPPMFRFADEGECRSALLAAGFAEVSFWRLPLHWNGGAPEAVLDLVHRGTVRTPMLIKAQAPEARGAIERAILEGAERYRADAGGIVLRWPALLTVARRA
ncbi:SAM-dependent methyltransferase [Siccirubricoccus deserti]|uniref:Methyltransferase domain-containing protein n=1 Tax=Siccirubricoccus deserti TaxID=2013562 RepID=A0A9X0R489_9PROT|nr:methyltransferase domain-containing protein [Siccirubricoccus deserti]MBC4019379.1 methyltransferase domain-containing protein [Siccirubricoccus deserti]GGC73601.1 SAM-dependent methyltransferase [Siccirubricoccus deserti]